MAAGRRLAAALGALTAGAVWALSAPAPALAHPFGAPQTIRIAAESDQVTIRWQAPADDLRMLGGALGALPDRQVVVIEPGAVPSPVGPSEADLLRGSHQLADYLATHILVRQDGVPCPSVVDLDDLLGDGALVAARCPEPVTTVEIEVSLLLEFHEAYRTAAIGTGTDPPRWMYTAGDTTRTWSFAGGPAGTAGPEDAGGTGGGVDAALFRAFDRGTALPLALLIAFAVGAGHGLAPGHGKTMAAAYLVGTHARRRHAVILAGIVAAMHTAAVLALGIAWWLLVDGGQVPVHAITTWAQVGVGLLVAATGVVLTRRRWRDHTRHDHTRHDHAPPLAGEPWSRAGLAGIASAGGLLPSPSAFLVLVGGLFTGRGWVAVAMVLAFGIGLATTVLAAGLLAVGGRDWLAHRSAPHGRLAVLLRHLPLVGSAAVIVGGVLIAGAAVPR